MDSRAGTEPQGSTGDAGPTGPTGPAGPAGGSLDTQIVVGGGVTIPVHSDPGTSASAPVTCPGSKKLLGGGGTIDSTGADVGQIALVKSYPSGPKTWTISAAVSKKNDHTASLHAYAVCTA